MRWKSILKFIHTDCEWFDYDRLLFCTIWLKNNHSIRNKFKKAKCPVIQLNLVMITAKYGWAECECMKKCMKAVLTFELWNNKQLFGVPLLSHLNLLLENSWFISEKQMKIYIIALDGPQTESIFSDTFTPTTIFWVALKINDALSSCKIWRRNSTVDSI